MQLDLNDLDKIRLQRISEETEYNSAEEFVKNALRRRLNELEGEVLTSIQLKGDLFRCETIPGDENSLTEIRFFPQEDAQIHFKYFEKGDPPHTAYLDTGNTVIGADEIEEALNNINGIERCLVPNTTGDIRLTVAEGNERPISEVIENIRDDLYELIRERDRRVERGEETRGDAKSRALRDYWKYAHQFGE
jgi:hypothetical protein